MQQFNDDVQAALQNTVYNSGGCRSYYFDKNGRNGFPSFQACNDVQH